MTDLAKWMAQGVDLQLTTRAQSIEAGDGHVRFVAEDGTIVAEGDHAVVTAPIPQMMELFDNGNVQLPAELDALLRQTSYFATLALLAVVEGEFAVDEPGGMQLSEGPFTFIADNHRKGISPVRALTFHAEHDYSMRRFDDDESEVHDELLSLAAPWIGSATVLDSQLKKWRYAGPVKPLAERTYVIDSGGSSIALAGDAFGGPKVEGAFNSGLAAAQALISLD